MEKYDITKPIKIPVGMHKLNDDAGISFQLNRLVNMDGCDLSVAREIGPAIKTTADFYGVLKSRAGIELEQGHIRNAAALYRMSEFYTDWEDPNGLAAWKKARELFFEYYADFFSGETPIVELINVPYEGYAMPTLKFNAQSAKGTIVMHGGFFAPRASAFDERVTKCVSVAQFGALKMNFADNAFVNGLIVGLLNVVLYGFGWLINIIYAAEKGSGMPFFRTYFHRMGTTNVYKLAKILWSIDLRPVADKLTKDYLVIGGSRDTMACRAAIGRHLLLLKNARSVSSREITTHEKGADHCCCGNQTAAMDTILSWAELMERRDSTLDESTGE